MADLDYAQLATVGKYGDPNVLLRGSWSIAGTKSLRFSCSAPPRDVGFNLQTFPRWARLYVVPPPGLVWVGFDQDQGELRALEGYIGCKYLWDRFERGIKVHKEFCSERFGIPYAAIDKEGPEYRKAKAGVHGTSYRMGVKKMAIEMGSTIKEARVIQGQYLRLAPEVVQYQEAIKQEVMRSWKLRNPFGLERVFYAARSKRLALGEFGNDEWNDACSWIPQSTIPIITNIIIRRVKERFGAEVVLHHQGHDSGLFSTTIDLLPRVAEAITEEASKVKVFLPARTITIPCEVTYGWSWGAMLPWKDDPLFLLRLSTRHEEWEEYFKKQLALEKILKSVYGLVA